MIRTVFVLWAATGIFAAKAQSSQDIVGLWYNEPKDAKIEVYQAANGPFEGKVVWLKDSIAPGGGVRLDVNNDDPQLQERPLIGLLIIKKLRWDTDEKRWDDGQIYDPRSGDTYSSYAELEKPDTLKIRGYLGFSLIGRTTYWTRIK